MTRFSTLRALAALSLLACTSAFAQKAALVQNVDDGIRAPLQIGVSYFGCGDFQGNCAIVFPAVPAGHRHMIEQLSCYVTLKAGGSLVAPLVLGSSNFRPASIYVPPVFVAAQRYVANASILLYYEAGEQPRVDAFSAGAAYSSFSCTISGRDVTVP